MVRNPIAKNLNRNRPQVIPDKRNKYIQNELEKEIMYSEPFKFVYAIEDADGNVIKLFSTEEKAQAWYAEQPKEAQDECTGVHQWLVD